MKKYLFSILFALITAVTFAQQSVTSFNAVKLVGSDSISGPVTVNGTVRFNPVSGKFRFREGGTWKSLGSGGGGGGSSTFVGLTDGPGSFSGHGLDFMRVNTGATQLEYRTPSQVRADIGAGTGNGDALTSGTLAQFAATTSAQFRALASDESGTGALLFAGGNIGTISGGVLTNATGLPAAAVVVTPAGGISSTNAGAAINELDTEKMSNSYSATSITDASTMDLTAIKHTLTTSSATRTFTISYTGDDIVLEVTLNAASSVFTFPATALCVSEGIPSEDNTVPLVGSSGDKYIIAIKKIGSNFYVVCKNFKQ